MECELLGRERELCRDIAIAIRQDLIVSVGMFITPSIGIASNQFLAKIAAEMEKPQGLVILKPEELPGPLLNLNISDLPGIASVQDLGDPENARRMGQALFDRWRRGDTPTNLSITSLITNAFLLTGEEKYRAWVVEYTDAWVERAKQNDGLLPDNVGLSGQVGEYLDGKWYGGRYGWTFPHGFLTLQKATLDAAANAYLLTRDAESLQPPRRQMDRILELGEIMDIRDHDMSVSERWTSQFASMGGKYETFLVPYRYGDAGWFDWQPISPVYLVTLWNLSMSDGDWERLERVRLLEAFDWDEVFPFHNKEDSGHEQPWVRYLMGENPAFPGRSCTDPARTSIRILTTGCSW